MLDATTNVAAGARGRSTETPLRLHLFLCMSLGAVLIKAAGWAKFSQLYAAKGEKKEVLNALLGVHIYVI